MSKQSNPSIVKKILISQFLYPNCAEFPNISE
jgi:hypothetical protein